MSIFDEKRTKKALEKAAKETGLNVEALKAKALVAEGMTDKDAAKAIKAATKQFKKAKKAYNDTEFANLAATEAFDATASKDKDHMKEIKIKIKAAKKADKAADKAGLTPEEKAAFVKAVIDNVDTDNYKAMNTLIKQVSKNNVKADMASAVAVSLEGLTKSQAKDIAKDIKDAGKGKDGMTFDDVIENADKATGDNTEIPGEDGEDGVTVPGSLTEALTALSNAQTAEVDYQKNLEIDAKIGAAEFKTKAGDAAGNDGVATAYFNAATAALASQGGTTLDAAAYADLSKQDLQNVDIQTAHTKAEADVTVATAQAKTGMTALIEKADAAQKEYKDALEAKTKADANFSAEGAAYNVANGAGADENVIFAADYVATDNNTGKIVISNGKAYTGQDGSGGTAVALSALVENTSIERVAQLEAAKAAAVAAANSTGTLLEALQEAVGDIYVLEAGGHSVKGTINATAVSTNGDYILTDANVAVFKTAADANKDVVQQVLTFTGETGSAAATITIDGVVVNIDADAVAAAIVARAADFTNWTVTASDPADEKVTFTAKTPSVNEIEATAIAVSGAVAKPSIGAATEINVGETVTLATGATNADNLKTKIVALEALEKAISDFQAARDVKVELEELKDAIAAATEAITDSVEDGGLGITLREGAQSFTTSDDIYLFSATGSAGVILNNFGAKGEDMIFFGTDFTGGLSVIEKIADNNGDVSKLDIFAVQKGANTELYIEEKTFAGNGSSNNADLVKITLTGVNA